MKKIINKWRKIPKTAKSSICFIISSFVVKGISFITTPLYTRIIDSTQYGIVSTYNSWLVILEIFALLGLTSAGVFNVGMNENKKNRSEYISTCLGLCNTATLIFLIIMMCLKNIFGADFILPNKYIVIMFLHFIFSPAQIFWITRERYEFKYKSATVISILSVVIGQILSVLFVLKWPNNSGFMKILGNEIGILVFSIPIYVYLIKSGKKIIDLKKWKYILVFALPLLPHYLSQHLMSSSDRIMISDMVSLSDAAIYNVVSNISVICTIFWSAINASLVPYSFEKMNENQEDEINKVSKTLLIGYFIICAFIILIAPEILVILAPKEYYSGIYVVPPITVVIFLQALYNLYANIEFYHKKTKNIALATTVSAILNLVLNYIFIPKFSFNAAAYTTLVSYICLAIMHYFNYKKCQKNKIYDNRFIFIITTILIVFSLFCNILYSFNILRYIFIAILLSLMILNYKKISKIMAQIKK